jgi:acyl-CoA synthetase (AMP-forming)/AMP-acid ligase II
LKAEQLTLPDLLTSARDLYPDHGVGFIQPDQEVHFHSFSDLYYEALGILTGLQSCKLRKGDKIILAPGKSEEIITTLWACFLGGIIPAILQPPVSFTEYNPAAEKIKRVFQKLDKPHVIISREHLPYWVSTGIDQSFLIPAQGLNQFSANPEIQTNQAGDLAFIQFSSGRTGEPKGIMLSHSNIIHNLNAIVHGIRLTPEDVGINWMPLYHDMGLIGFHLTPLSAKTTHYILDTQDFIKNPLLWLDVLQNYKGTITASPNFGQELVRRAVQRNPEKRWDLSKIRILFNGAEPISPRVMRHFLEKMQAFNLRPSAMLPAYGMAEATLAVTFSVHPDNPRLMTFDMEELLKNGLAVISGDKKHSGIHLVNLGKTIQDCELRIIGDQGGIITENRIGNIQIRGKNVTHGYFHDEINTSTLFDDGWMNTGDLGFLHDGNLFITGRKKDVIFINGTNYYAQDLEEFAGSLDEIQQGKIVISGYFDQSKGMDRILVFMVGTYNETSHSQYLRIKSDFQHQLGLRLDTFIPVRSNEVPHTSSGKLQRYKMVEKFLKGEFPRIITL